MNDKTELQTVQEYCQQRSKSSVVTSLAYSIYQQQLEELVTENTNGNAAPTDAEISTMKTTLLSQNSLSAHVRFAEEMLSTEVDKAITPHINKEGSKTFWTSVGGSIVANFIYSILMILLFVVAQDQIGSWLSSLPEKP